MELTWLLPLTKTELANFLELLKIGLVDEVTEQRITLQDCESVKDVWEGAFSSQNEMVIQEKALRSCVYSFFFSFC